MNYHEFNRKHNLITRHDYNQKMIDYGLTKSHGALMGTCLDNDKGPLSRRAVAESIFALWGNELHTAARDSNRERADFAKIFVGPVIGSKMQTIRRRGRPETGLLWETSLKEAGYKK